MISIIKKIIISLNYFRIFPVWIVMKSNKDSKLWKDFLVWRRKEGLIDENELIALRYLLCFRKEFCRLVFYRLKSPEKYLFRMFFRCLDSLYITTDDIGEGLFIQHGFSTIIAARKIGCNCQINQQVTIGYEGNDNPIIGDNVRICCGAIIIGDVKIGNDCTIAAGSVVTKDVPDGETWGGVPAHNLHER